jgi:hypothetical protein
MSLLVEYSSFHASATVLTRAASKLVKSGFTFLVEMRVLIVDSVSEPVLTLKFIATG